MWSEWRKTCVPAFFFSPHCESLLHSPFSFLLHPNIHFWILFSNTFSLYSFLNLEHFWNVAHITMIFFFLQCQSIYISTLMALKHFELMLCTGQKLVGNISPLTWGIYRKSDEVTLRFILENFLHHHVSFPYSKTHPRITLSYVPMEGRCL